MTWDEFEQRLISALRELGNETFLVICSRGDKKRYVQFVATHTELRAETSENADISADAYALVPAAGWLPSEPGMVNWCNELPLPALTADYAALAHRCVVSLRHAFGIASPDLLRYRAWRDAEYEPPHALHVWFSLDPGENPMPFPGLGLTMVEPR